MLVDVGEDAGGEETLITLGRGTLEKTGVNDEGGAELELEPDEVVVEVVVSVGLL